jgi:hypothetical protein
VPGESDVIADALSLFLARSWKQDSDWLTALSFWPEHRVTGDIQVHRQISKKNFRRSVKTCPF